MTSRPRLTRSIPFWVLFVGSLALTGFGAWMVFDRLSRFEESVRTGAADQAQQLEISISSYVVAPSATVGGIILGAGLVGLLLTAAVAALATLLPRPAADVVEEIDASRDDESGLDADEILPGVEDPSDPPASAHAAPRLDDQRPLVVSEDPDVETPSDAPAPPRS